MESGKEFEGMIGLPEFFCALWPSAAANHTTQLRLPPRLLTTSCGGAKCRPPLRFAQMLWQVWLRKGLKRPRDMRQRAFIRHCDARLCAASIGLCGPTHVRTNRTGWPG